MIRPLGTRERWLILAVGLAWALSVALWFTPGYVRPDGIGYFEYLPSSWNDHDLVFYDQWAQARLVVEGRLLFKEVAPNGYLANHWPSGSAVFWYPAYVTGDFLRGTPPFRGFPPNGFSLPYEVPVVAFSAVAGLLTLFLVYRLSRKVATPGAAFLATIGIWFGSPLLWYSLVNGITSHVVAAMSAAIFVALALSLRERLDSWSVFALGLSLGFVFAVRPQNATLALVPFFLIPRDRWRALLGESAPGIAGTLIGALPQLVVSSVIYGNPLGFLVTGGAGEAWSSFQRIWIWEPIFSWYHGLVTWTPFLALGIIGLIFLFRIDRGLAAAALWAFAAQWAINATLDRAFWGAFAFGQRRFDGVIVFFGIGAAVLLDRLPRWAAVVLTVAASGWTMMLLLASRSVLDLNLYYPPGDLLRAIGTAVTHTSRWLAPLSALPPIARLTVGLLIVGGLAVAAAIAAVFLVLSRLGGRRAVTIAAALWLLAAGGWFAWVGWAGAPHLRYFDRLITFNRSLGALSGGLDSNISVLESELQYLEKSGRTGLAERTKKDLARLVALRQRELRRRGMTSPAVE
ncbi:MAG: glycosyltransferase family 39 protein [Thermoanaerobaculia bacterium]